MSDDYESSPPEESGGSLADAIAQHLALKREHGADPDEVEHELEAALSPPSRDEPLPEVPQSEPEPAPAPEPARAPAPEPAAETEPDQQPAAERPQPKRAPQRQSATSPEPQPAGDVGDEPERAPEPVNDEPQAARPSDARPGEITGTIEFEFGDEAEPEPAQEAEPEHDLLEDTPDFFEETPEHDKLWFDEAPPRKFDF